VAKLRANMTTKEKADEDKVLKEKEVKDLKEKATKDKAARDANPKPKKYACIIARMWHPYQRLHVEFEGTVLALDSWVQVQLDAGLIREM